MPGNNQQTTYLTRLKKRSMERSSIAQPPSTPYSDRNGMKKSTPLSSGLVIRLKLENTASHNMTDVQTLQKDIHDIKEHQEIIAAMIADLSRQASIQTQELITLIREIAPIYPFLLEQTINTSPLIDNSSLADMYPSIKQEDRVEWQPEESKDSTFRFK